MFVFVLLLTNSCKKDKQSGLATDSEFYNSEYYQDESPATDLEPRIKNYLNELNGLGNGEYDSLAYDSTLFYCEAGLNYEYGNFGLQYDSLFEVTNSFTLSVSNTEFVLASEANNVYDEMATWVYDVYTNTSGSNKTIAAIQLEDEFNGTSGYKTINVRVLMKKGTLVIEEDPALSFTGDYYWDRSSGICGVGGSGGAATQLEYKGNYNMNRLQLVPASGQRFYITNHTRVTKNVQNIPVNYNNPFYTTGGVTPHDIWAYESAVNSPGPCIPEEMGDYYLNLIPSVIGSYRPSTFTFVSLMVDIGGEISTPAPEYMHFYRITYGKVNTTPDPTVY